MNDLTFAGQTEQNEEKKLHSHKGYEIIFCTEDGTLSAETERKLHAKCVAIIPPNVKHSFSGKGVRAVIERALIATKRVLILDESDKMNDLYAILCLAQNEKNEAVLSAYGDLITAFVSSYAQENSYSPVVKIVMAEISKNVSNTAYSLEDSLKNLPLNYDYVRKLFKKETGVTPHEYLISSRMELAKEMLLSGITNSFSNYTISQIAEACGFAEPLYFSRVFKKYYGISPSEYKNL